jgi:hypothetical protein
LGFDGLSAATQCSALSGNHRVTLVILFNSSAGAAFGGMGVYRDVSVVLSVVSFRLICKTRFIII